MKGKLDHLSDNIPEQLKPIFANGHREISISNAGYSFLDVELSFYKDDSDYPYYELKTGDEDSSNFGYHVTIDCIYGYHEDRTQDFVCFLPVKGELVARSVSLKTDGSNKINEVVAARLIQLGFKIPKKFVKKANLNFEHIGTYKNLKHLHYGENSVLVLSKEPIETKHAAIRQYLSSFHREGLVNALMDYSKEFKGDSHSFSLFESTNVKKPKRPEPSTKVLFVKTDPQAEFNLKAHDCVNWIVPL